MALQLIYVDDSAPGACGDAGVVYNGSTTLTSSKIIAGTSMTMSGTAAITGNVTMGGTSAITGNTTVGGTLGVTGASTLASVTVTGATVMNGGITCDTDKFTVADTSGNTSIGGTLAVTGATTFTGAVTANGGITLGAGDSLIGSATSDITFNTDKFTVAGATGNTVVAGTLGVTGASTFTGDIQSNGHITIATTKNLVCTSDSDILVNTNKFTVAGTSGNTVVAGTFTAQAACILSAAEVAATSGAVTIPVTNVYSGYTTNGTNPIAATLADGAVGQLKVIKLTTKDTNNMVVTPASLTGGTTITFDTTGEYALLMFVGTAWVVISTNATLA